MDILTNLIEDNIKGYLNLNKKVFPFSLLVSTSNLIKLFPKFKEENLIITWILNPKTSRN
jgi:hypothetical protein